MKVTLFVLVVVGAALAGEAHIGGSRSEVRENDGSYALQYNTDHGIQVQQQGAIKKAKSLGNVLVQKGSYRYISPEGVPVEVEYVADEHGFRAFSKNLVLPEVPQVPDGPTTDYVEEAETTEESYSTTNWS